MAQGKDVRAAAKVLYESGKMTVKQVAAEIGISSRTVERWAAADGWERVKPTPEMTERAHRVASKLADTPENATPEQRQNALAAVTEDEVVAQRADLITRHRTEWRVIGGLITESVKERNIDRAKLAETLARSMKLKQDGERRAWGLEAGEGDQKVHVIIERQ